MRRDGVAAGIVQRDVPKTDWILVGLDLRLHVTRGRGRSSERSFHVRPPPCGRIECADALPERERARSSDVWSKHRRTYFDTDGKTMEDLRPAGMGGVSRPRAGTGRRGPVSPRTARAGGPRRVPARSSSCATRPPLAVPSLSERARAATWRQALLDAGTVSCRRPRVRGHAIPRWRRSCRRCSRSRGRGRGHGCACRAAALPHAQDRLALGATGADLLHRPVDLVKVKDGVHRRRERVCGVKVLGEPI